MARLCRQTCGGENKSETVQSREYNSHVQYLTEYGIVVGIDLRRRFLSGNLLVSAQQRVKFGSHHIARLVDYALALLYHPRGAIALCKASPRRRFSDCGVAYYVALQGNCDMAVPLDSLAVFVALKRHGVDGRISARVPSRGRSRHRRHPYCRG